MNLPTLGVAVLSAQRDSAIREHLAHVERSSAASAIVIIDAGGDATSVEHVTDLAELAKLEAPPRRVPPARPSRVLTPLLAAIGVMAPPLDLARERSAARRNVAPPAPFENPPGSTLPEVREARKERRARAMARRARQGRR